MIRIAAGLRATVESIRGYVGLTRLRRRLETQSEDRWREALRLGLSACHSPRPTVHSLFSDLEQRHLAGVVLALAQAVDRQFGLAGFTEFAILKIK